MPILRPEPIPVPPRCFHRSNPSDLAGCGELAAWLRPSNSGFPAGYYCDQHRSPSDEPIGEAYLFSRVDVIAEIVIAGVDFAARPAMSEALDRIGAAVASIGGVFSLVDISANITRAPRQGAPGAAIAVVGRGFGRGWGS